MPMTIADVEDAYLVGRAEVEAWKAEFVRNWFKPYTDMALLMFWQQTAPAVHANLKAMDPVSYGQVEDQVKQIMAGGK